MTRANREVATDRVVSEARTANSDAMIRRVYDAWDEALARSDFRMLLLLYARDATIESPLIPHLLGKARGICHGHDEIRPLFEALAQRKPKIRKHYRTGYCTDGKKFMWEYPRATPEGDQMDFVEVMELNDDGLIQHHRVYWGWLGFGVLQRDEYR